MENDNVYPNTGQTYFTPKIPQGQQDTKAKEVQETLDQLPLLKQVLKRLDNRIAATDSVKQTLVVSEKYKVSKENALIILDVVNQQIATERSFIQTRIERTLKR